MKFAFVLIISHLILNFALAKIKIKDIPNSDLSRIVKVLNDNNDLFSIGMRGITFTSGSYETSDDITEFGTLKALLLEAELLYMEDEDAYKVPVNKRVAITIDNITKLMKWGFKEIDFTLSRNSEELREAVEVGKRDLVNVLQKAVILNKKNMEIKKVYVNVLADNVEPGFMPFHTRLILIKDLKRKEFLLISFYENID
jgi:hypothetical protein